jgi:predicted  nucleic acid-binding Zn-ribbon protein
MEDQRSGLLALQDLDDEIQRAKAKLEEFDPRLKELAQPVTALETELNATKERLTTLRGDVRRLERGAEQKRERLRVYEDRLSRVRNPREEAAARTEMDLVRRATEADETEALEQMEMATRTDLKVDDLERQLQKLRAEIAPAREEVVREREEAEQQLAILQDRRNNHALRVDAAALRLYERVRGGRSKKVVAPLTAEGACGNCFNILPIQEQAHIKDGSGLHRCEACGVILYWKDEQPAN